MGYNYKYPYPNDLGKYKDKFSPKKKLSLRAKKKA